MRVERAGAWGLFKANAKKTFFEHSPRAVAPRAPFHPIRVPVLKSHLYFEHSEPDEEADRAESRELVAR